MERHGVESKRIIRPFCPPRTQGQLAQPPNAGWPTTKGQIVIPLRLCNNSTSRNPVEFCLDA